MAKVVNIKTKSSNLRNNPFMSHVPRYNFYIPILNDYNSEFLKVSLILKIIVT